MMELQNTMLSETSQTQEGNRSQMEVELWILELGRTKGSWNWSVHSVCMSRLYMAIHREIHHLLVEGYSSHISHCYILIYKEQTFSKPISLGVKNLRRKSWQVGGAVSLQITRALVLNEPCGRSWPAGYLLCTLAVLPVSWRYYHLCCQTHGTNIDQILSSSNCKPYHISKN